MVGKNIWNITENTYSKGNILVQKKENNPAYKNAFEWRFEFPQVLAENGDFVGFDLVIGNPPYIQLQANNGYLGKMFENKGWDTFAKSGDIYALFYEQSHSCFITSNKWLRAGYGENLRKYILNKTNLINLYDVGSGVFESATVDTNILLFQKSNAGNLAMICTYKNNKLNPKSLSNYWQDNAVSINPAEVFDGTGKGGWFLGSPAEFHLKKKIETNGKPLKDWDIKINYGIKTGLNEAFIIDTETKNRLCQEDPKSADIIKPILRGRDIKRYSYEWKDLWVINAHNGYKSEIPLLRGGNEVDGVFSPIDINNYPAIKTHLDQFEPALSKRSDKGKTPYNLRHCAYLDEFEKEKVVYSEIVQEPQFYLDTKGEFYAEATSFIMTGENLRLVMAILHSKAGVYFFKNYYAGGGLGNTGFRYKKAFLEQLPIPLLDTPEKQKIAQGIEVLVEEILAIKNQESGITAHLETQIDHLVYQLYNLTAEEIRVVEGL
jgi:adenine-specific DNA-methyltransferase